MPLTPQEVASKSFGPTRMRRGYDENEVDSFLDVVEAELTRLTNENARLHGEIEAAGRIVPDAPAAPADSLEPVALTPVATLPPASPVSSPASAAGDQEGIEPEHPVTRLLILAQQTADAALLEAQSDADRTRGAARNEAERVVSGAQLLAAQIIGDLERNKASLEADVEALQALWRECRQKLRTYLSSQLSELDSKAGLDDSVADHPPLGRGAPTEFDPVWSPGNGSHAGPDFVYQRPARPAAAQPEPRLTPVRR